MDHTENRGPLHHLTSKFGPDPNKTDVTRVVSEGSSVVQSAEDVTFEGNLFLRHFVSKRLQFDIRQT